MPVYGKDNDLVLNIDKTRELIVDYRRKLLTAFLGTNTIQPMLCLWPVSISTHRARFHNSFYQLIIHHHGFASNEDLGRRMTTSAAGTLVAVEARF